MDYFQELQVAIQHPGRDQIQIGPTTGHPWTFFIICDVPDYETVPKVVDQLRHGDPPLFKYIKLEARMGRPLEVIGLAI